MQSPLEFRFDQIVFAHLDRNKCCEQFDKITGTKGRFFDGQKYQESTAGREDALKEYSVVHSSCLNPEIWMDLYNAGHINCHPFHTFNQ